MPSRMPAIPMLSRMPATHTVSSSRRSSSRIHMVSSKILMASKTLTHSRMLDTVRMFSMFDCAEMTNTISLEMDNMNGQAGRANNPQQILEDCREIDRGIDQVDSRLEQLKGLQSQALNETDVSSNSPVAREIERLMVDVETSYRGLVNRMKAIKSNPESGSPRNAPQVGRVDRRLKDAVQRNMQIRRDYEKKCKEQFERNYRIVRPQASDAEVREAAEDPSNTQVFSQAVCLDLNIMR